MSLLRTTVLHGRHGLCGLCVLLGHALLAQDDLRAVPRGGLMVQQPAAAHVIQDLDGDGRAELLTLGRDGAVRVFGWGSQPGELLERGAAQPLQLPEPDSSLCALADVLGGPELELVVLSRRGIEAWSLREGSFRGEPVVLTSVGRVGFRVGEPRLVEFVQDIDGDGRLDFVVPLGAECQVWLSRAPASGAEGDRVPILELTQTLPVPAVREQRVLSGLLSDELRNRIQVPRLDIADLNGDGRPDLRVREDMVRSFYLQSEPGRFSEKPISVDLSIFRDTTPAAKVQVGETLVVGDKQQMQAGDLNGDGIPDYVIAHRRKVWSFLSSGSGPQFTSASTRIVAEDVSGFLLVHLDDDDRKDLVILKLEVPTVAQLLLGVVSSIDIGIEAFGYPTQEDGTFAPRAKWRRSLTLRTPSLLNLLGEAEALVERFTDVLSKFRWSSIGDFDGDGIDDLSMLGDGDEQMELWRRPEASPRPERSGDRWFRELMFENPDTLFDLDRLIKLAAQVFDSRTSALTGDRQPDAVAALEPGDGRYIVDLVAADLDGDGRDELVLVDDEEATPGMLGFRVWSWQE